MNANEIIQTLNEQLKKHLDDNNLVEVNIPAPSKAILEGLDSLGVSYDKRYDKWCHSNNCNCNSHDPGQNYIIAFLPSAWLVDYSADCESVFEYRDNGDNNPICLLPLENKTGLIFSISDGHYAQVSRMCYPSELPNAPNPETDTIAYAHQVM